MGHLRHMTQMTVTNLLCGVHVTQRDHVRFLQLTVTRDLDSLSTNSGL